MPTTKLSSMTKCQSNKQILNYFCFIYKMSYKSKSDSQERKSDGGTAIRGETVLDRLERNIAETKHFLYRLVAIGAHTEVPDKLVRLKEQMLMGINAICTDEPGTGVLVVWPKYFLHILEGSEETLNRYIKECAEEFEIKNPNPSVKQLKVKMKILSYIRVDKRSTEKLTSITRTDPGKCEIYKKFRGFRNRLFQMNKLAWTLSHVVLIFLQPEDVSPPQDPEEFPDPEDQELVIQANKNLDKDFTEELNTYFPNIQTFQYFMKPKKRIPPLRTPKEHMERFWGLPKLILDSETQWPIPSRLAPYNYL